MYELRRSHVAWAILDYLWKHPEAQDTLSGISQWWLPEEKVTSRTATIKEALTDLVGKGLVLERRGRDSQIHYRINRRKLHEVRAFLKHHRL